ncbi:MAG: DUF2306 domain-containing protein [Cyclobacteriaceae bacterium]|nr:DUF2306 domain-containing protein [Cyclobacteriaceae bacterium]
MTTLVHSTTGFIHLFTAIGAMATGTLVLMLKKGTRTHRFIGYLYFYLMLVMNSTAFMLYGLFGTFGPFHVAAVASLITVLFGLIPVIRRKPGWLRQHLTFMYYSIVGLYAAFASETLTRIPKSPFFTMVIIATIAITIAGVFIFKRMKPIWLKRHG